LRRPAVRSRAKSATAFGFREQLNHLMGLLGRSTAHYVRALNPNAQRKPFTFLSALIRQQLVNNGVKVRGAPPPPARPPLSPSSAWIDIHRRLLSRASHHPIQSRRRYNNTQCTDVPQHTGAHHPIQSRGGTTAHSVLTSHNTPVPTTPYSPGGGTTAHNVLTSHNTPVPTTP
jgi:hypothetical protein